MRSTNHTANQNNSAGITGHKWNKTGKASMTLNYGAITCTSLPSKHNLEFPLCCCWPTCTCQQYKTVECWHWHPKNVYCCRATQHFVLLSTINILRPSCKVSDTSFRFLKMWGFSTDCCKGVSILVNGDDTTKESKYTIALKPSGGSSDYVWGWRDSRKNWQEKADGGCSLFLWRCLKRFLKLTLVVGLLLSQNDWKTIYRQLSQLDLLCR
jgi:hypothetical protein